MIPSAVGTSMEISLTTCVYTTFKRYCAASAKIACEAFALYLHHSIDDSDILHLGDAEHNLE